MQVTFASTNQNKYNEVRSILAPHNISVDFLQAELVEIQSDSLEEIAREKAKSAYEKAGRPVIVEDDGLFIDALGGFPGQYSSYVFKTVGNAGILKLLEGKARTARFLSIIAYTDGKSVGLFEGNVEGEHSGKGGAGRVGL
ncbi:non-canonical purine NTP pyrophosphatase [Candidatus Nitrososphaera sp. FF02]|uniref:non-canonical purine NTP pyrophosphatase n=1 Tax=Candidatus Nitrososphaera sp. FF02 TaxID=3398226 RepID=UPI0039ECE09E